MRLHLRRAALAAAGVSVALTTAVSSPGYAAAETDQDRAPVRAGAAWLSDELTGGLVHNEQFDFDDYGLTIDVALGLAEVGKEGKVATITRAVAENVRSYTTGIDFGSDDVYAGATAKAATLAIVAGRNPERFGGVDLIAQLEALVSSSGRIADKSEFGDFSNVVGQSYAVRALTAASSKRAPKVVSYLLKQQCDKGFFRLNFTADPAAADQTCSGAPAADRAPDTDATAIATMALLEAKSTSKVTRAIKRASAWLADAQRRNGGFGGGPTTARPNTNSTGLAGWVLGDRGFEKAAARAAAFVRKHEAVAVARCGTELDDEDGAIGYDVRAVRAGETDGITDVTRDQWRRASAQALPVLTWAPAATDPLSITGTTTAEKVRLSIAGVAPGERVCVTGPGARKAVYGGWRSTHLAVDLPTGTSSATYRVVNSDGETAKVVVDLG
jgi:hypothetical protein